MLLAMGFVHPVHDGMLKSLGVELDPRGNVKADTARLPDVAAEGVRRRRHAPRPVARGLGDPRGPPVRPRDRQVPDGNDDAAALRSRSAPAVEEAAAAKTAAAATVVDATAAAAAAAHGVRATRRRRRVDRRRRYGGAAADCICGSGSVVVATTGSLPKGATSRRGQAKSSLRPCGRRDRFALHQHARCGDVIGCGTCVGRRRAGPRWSRRWPPSAATTGPASGRAIPPPVRSGRRRRRRLRLAGRQRHRDRAARRRRGGFRARRSARACGRPHA